MTDKKTPTKRKPAAKKTKATTRKKVAKKTAKKNVAKKKVVKKKTIARKTAAKKKPATKKSSVKKKAPPAKRKKRKAKKRTTKKKTLIKRFFIYGVLPLFIITSVVFGAWLYHINKEIVAHFDGKRWDIPAQIYSEPRYIDTDVNLSYKQMLWLLDQLGYRKVTKVYTSGQYSKINNSTLRIATRQFNYWHEPISAETVTINFARKRISSVSEPFWLEPLRIGTLSPGATENRILMSLDDQPYLLERALLLAEDEGFYKHHGISLRGIAGAIAVNIKARGLKRGGSTITQQLVKNLYLSNERTLKRKLREVCMSILLDAQYDKKNILKAYYNEVFLGQSGSHAIHGFAIGSYYYFGKPINELELHQTALLVALIKGPTYYNPRRKTERIVDRRNWVIDRLAQAGEISQEKAEEVKKRDLGVTDTPRIGGNRFPAFNQLVRREFSDTFLNRIGSKEGLHVITTLDPLLQLMLEKQIKAHAENTNNKLEVASVVGDVETGAIRAIVGSKTPQFEGFNRALDANRPIGSLIKPIVSLQAMLMPDQFNVLTPLHDELTPELKAQLKQWRPQNYDKRAHGNAPEHLVPLQDALAKSYNVATVDLGMRIGLKKIVKLIRRLGYEGDVNAYPSLLLGTIEMSPREVLELYQALASGRDQQNFVITAVYSEDDKHKYYQPARPGPRFINEDTQYLMRYLGRQVLEQGTAQKAMNYLQGGVAGKTGTTGGGRDLWFAGWDNQHVAVFWSGLDNNKPTGKTSSHVVPLWAKFMRDKGVVPLSGNLPENIEWVWLNESADALSDPTCYGAKYIPILKHIAQRLPQDCFGMNALDESYSDEDRYEKDSNETKSSSKEKAKKWRIWDLF